MRDMIVAKAFAEPGLLEDSVPGEVRDPVQVKEDAERLATDGLKR
jgi:hypothetical protein